MHLIGRGRYRTEAYPVAGASSAVSALQNRNISGPHSLTVPYTPATTTPATQFAAVLFTPRVSGVIQVSVGLAVVNGATADTYAVLVSTLSGTGLTVTGGETTDDGWVMGTNTPPVIGGVSAPDQLLGEIFEAVAITGSQSFVSFGISKPFPVGVPIVVQAGMAEAGAAHDLTGFLITGLSVVELP